MTSQEEKKMERMGSNVSSAVGGSMSLEQIAELEVEMGEISQKAADRFDRETRLPKLRFEIITHAKPLGYLGAGGFCRVYRVRLDNKKVVARKGLKDSIKTQRHVFKQGAVDMVTEAKLLNALSHPNILGLEGVSTDNWKDSYLNGQSFYLYLDRLSGDVRERFEHWEDTKENSSISSHLVKRLETIAIPIAKAVAYLHERHIIFRDLKPANMGIDMHNVVKLCDFGFAREIIDPEKKLTGYVGTPLYMSPEVALSERYGFPADVYSYAMFLFECISLTKPCIEMIRADDPKHFEQKVVHENYRPPLTQTKLFTEKLQAVLSKSWDRNPSVRPTMEEAAIQLEEATAEIAAVIKERSWFPSWTLSTTNTGDNTWATSTYLKFGASPKAHNNENHKNIKPTKQQQPPAPPQQRQPQQQQNGTISKPKRRINVSTFRF
ncbi:Mitogen-activated protein kinase HOG1 (Fragment) [Seminavis robusta]|uniref:Mitogen-activated protein kinase HOG1 n=1 Tax=Seminavis robusta TaxID=568900 RepID=A0A9N8DJB4_9STRA